MRTAIIGNIAQNAYVLAGGLRQLGVEADSYDFGGGNVMWVPWWEDAIFDETKIGGEHWDWEHLAATDPDTGLPYRRPHWAKILGNDSAEPWYNTQAEFQRDLARIFPGLNGPVRDRRENDRDLAAALAESRLAPNVPTALSLYYRNLPSWRSVLAVARRYDLTVLMGPTAGYGVLFPPDLPYVTFEHSTMRHVPQFGTGDHHVLAAAYQRADWNIVTNADCGEAARNLGLSRYSFIPHPLHDDRFTPGPSIVREQLLQATGCQAIFYAPARHSSSEASGSKRNDRVLHAFSRYVREAEPAGAPRAILLLSCWGEHVKESERLIVALGLHSRVKWGACLPKRKLPELYRAADVVIDQFAETVGSFGTVTAEALACGRPVITHINPAVHEWCMPDLPPVINALYTDQIYEAMVGLAMQPELGAEAGRLGREWIEQHHSLRIVSEAHRDLYERVLQEHRATRTAAKRLAREQQAAMVSDPPPSPESVFETDAGPIGIGLPIAAPLAEAVPV